MSWQVQGFKAWLLQRLSAVYLGVFIIVALTWFVSEGNTLDYPQWYSLMTRPLVNVSVLLFFYSMLLHAWVGIRDIIIDYIPSSTLRVLLLVVIMLGLFIMSIWVSLILLSVVHL